VNSGFREDMAVRRRTIYLAAAVATALLYVCVRESTWQGSTQNHTLTESATTLIALIVGILALVRFYSKKLNTFLFIGSGFLGAGFLDGYHALVSSPAFKQFFPSPPPSLVPWSGFASRLFLAVLLWLSWVFWKREVRLGDSGTVRESRVYLVAGLWLFACFSFFVLVPLPLGYNKWPLFHRPQELIPAFFFGLALIGYLRKGSWKKDPFEHWLVLTMILCIAQALCMSTSDRLYDTMYIASHLLKILSYLCTLTGLFSAVYYLFLMNETVLSERTEKLRQEIDERKKVEEQLRLQATALNSAANAIVITDAQGTIQWVNPAFTHLTGYKPEEAIGQNPRILKSGVQDEGFYQELWRSILAGQIWKSEITNRKKNGEAYVEDITIAPVRSAAGQITNFVAIKQDVTERKHAQAELTRAKELAEGANRAKSEFLANMSHELRTPLNGIMGMTELALETDLTSEQREYLTMSKTSTDALLALINDILDFSKIEAGKLEFESIEFNLRNSLEAALKLLGPRAHEKGLELNCHVQPQVPETLRGDPSRLRQIIVNLTGNAIKFTERGEVTVAVEVVSVERCKAMLHFRVTDTGIGIPPDRQQVIFDAFAQADGSTTRRYGGSGLGLTVSRRLVEIFGGRLWLESAVGRGSTFHFTVELAPGNDSGWAAPLAATHLEGVPVLVVDDNRTNRRILQEILAGWRMKPTAVEHAEVAWQQLHEAAAAGRPFRLLLVDARMPDVDGFALVERIKQDARLGITTIMMLTSGGQRGDAARCREQGVAAYLTKPIGRTELLTAILQVLGPQSDTPDQVATLVTRHSLREHQKGLRILLAEDNLVNRLVALRLLERHGYVVEVAEDGREAVAKAKAGNFDVVLMDVQMPEMDGLEATQAIREMEKHRGSHVPIIAMTAHALKGDRERCLEAGMDAYISKPFKMEELLNQIEKIPELLTSIRRCKKRELKEMR